METRERHREFNTAMISLEEDFGDISIQGVKDWTKALNRRISLRQVVNMVGLLDNLVLVFSFCWYCTGISIQS